MSSSLIIRTCHHILSSGLRCRGTAVRGRACCRHHLDARTRLHNMARARRLARIPRLCVPMTPRDLAANRAEVLRVVNTGGLDFASARLMLWAMDLTAATLPPERASRPRRAHNPNVSYHVPLNPLFARSCIESPSQVPENTSGEGRGVRRYRPVLTAANCGLCPGTNRRASTKRRQEKGKLPPSPAAHPLEGNQEKVSGMCPV
jgi:hypothetical protein